MNLKYPVETYYPMYHCRACGWFFKDRQGTIKEGLHGQQSTVEDITCEARRIEAELPALRDTGTTVIMIPRRK